MKRHGFDMFSFLAGVFFLAVSVPLLFADVDLTPYRGRWIVPGILVIAGLVMLGAGWRGEVEVKVAEVGPAADDDEEPSGP
jgi:hypothetical protein